MTGPRCTFCKGPLYRLVGEMITYEACTTCRTVSASITVRVPVPREPERARS